MGIKLLIKAQNTIPLGGNLTPHFLQIHFSRRTTVSWSRLEKLSHQPLNRRP